MTKDGKARDTRTRDGKAKDGKERLYNARVFVSLKATVNDPQGNTIADALGSLGFPGIEKVRSGKYFQLSLRAGTPRKAEKQVDQMCSRLLANPVIESYRFEVAEA